MTECSSPLPICAEMADTLRRDCNRLTVTITGIHVAANRKLISPLPHRCTFARYKAAPRVRLLSLTEPKAPEFPPLRNPLGSLAAVVACLLKGDWECSGLCFGGSFESGY
jgi:hypothetical protein